MEPFAVVAPCIIVAMLIFTHWF